MRKFLRTTKALLVAAGLLTGANAWAVDVPRPVYSNDFSSTDGLTIPGSGSFQTSSDARFGQYFQNVGGTVRTNYLLLPSSTLSGLTSEKTGMTIGFWVNANGASDFFWSPLFCALDQAPVNGENEWTMFYAGACTYLRYNLNDYSGGWCDFTYSQNNNPDAEQSTDNDKNRLSSAWLDDKVWHYYTVTLTNSASGKASVYVDGEIKNSWTADFTGLFSTIANLTYPCLGGNQYAAWSDKDAAFAFDDFAVYDQALSADQIAQIMANKLHYTVNAVDGSDNILKVLKDENSLTNSVSVTYPRYILDGTTLRETAATSSNYTKTYTLTTGNQTEKIEYTNSTVSNVYYYAEGEDVLTNNRTLGNQSLSMNMIGYTTDNTTYVKVTTLPAGTWTITARYFCGNTTGDHKGYIKVGDDVKWSQEYASGSGGNSEKSSESFTITQPTAVYVAADGGNGTGFDWFYVSGTPSNTIVGQPDCSTGYLVTMTDKVELTSGQSYHYMFVNHNMGSTAGWAQNWILPVYASDGTTNKIVVRADNWEDVAWKNDGFSWTTSSGAWTDDFLTEMDGAIVDMTVNYSADKVFTMSSNITTSTGRTLTYNYNSTSGKITLTDESIKVALSVSMSWLELLYEGSTGNVTKPITVAGWATYCSPYALDLEHATNLTDAFIVTGGENGVLTKTSVKSGAVPAKTGLLLKGTEGSAVDVTIPVAATAGVDVTANKLVGVTASETLAANGGYVLMTTPSLAFYKNNNDFTLSANSAYLPAGFDGAGARSAFLLFGDESTGINTVNSEEFKVKSYYNLSGQRVAAPQKGLYIVNGKKVAIK